jgi:chromosome segregation ATPase
VHKNPFSKYVALCYLAGFLLSFFLLCGDIMSVQPASPEILQAIEQLWVAMRRAGDMVLHLRTENIGLRERAGLFEEQNYEQQKRLISLEMNAEELAELRIKADEHEEDLSRKDDTIADMSRDLAHKEGTLRAMDEQAMRYVERVKELETTARDTQKSLGELGSEIHFLRERTEAFDALTDDMRRLREDKEILQKELVQRNKELIRHTHEVAEYKETIALLQNQLFRQEQDAATRLQSIEHDAKVRFSEQLDKADEQYTRLLAEYDSAKQAMVQERERVQGETRTVQQHYEEELTVLRQTHHEEVELMQLDLDLTKQEVEEYKKKIEHQEQALIALRASLDAEYAKTEAAIATAIAQAHTLSEERLQDQANRFTDDIEALHQKEAELRMAIETSTAQQQHIRIEVGQKEEMILHQEEMILHLRAQVEQARLHIDEEKALLRADVEQAIHVVEEQIRLRESLPV